MAHDVFICHSSRDADRAEAFCEHLESAGIRCWIAPRDPVPGIPYGGQLVDAIGAVRVVLLVLSAHSSASRHVLNEIALAANRNKVILPVRIDEAPPTAELEFYIRSIHWFNATAAVEVVMHELADTVAALVNATSRTTPAAPAGAIGALPVPVSSFVGRERELAEITRALESSRLVSIVGPGGTGKTRTALRVLESLPQALRPTVAFVDLAPITDASLLPGAVAKAAGIVLASHERDALADALRTRELFLLIDNCEHVLNDAALLCSALLRLCPGVRILATSRQGLSIDGETVYRLLPLQEAEAIQLFQARALSVNSRFNPGPADEAFVSKICRQLDGIPLAVELAAARMNALNPRRLFELLEERFTILTGGGPDRLPRQKTLQATINWSFDLLTEDEKTLFRRIATFVDGFSLEAAMAVCAEPPSRASVIETLSSLVDKSLVIADLSGDELRYRMFASIRAYARTKLAEAGETYAFSDRHLAYFTGLFQGASREWEARLSAANQRSFEAELEDVRKALEWAFQSNQAAAGVDLFLAVRFWDPLGLHGEAIERARRLIHLLGNTDQERRASLWEYIAFLAIRCGNVALSTEAAKQAIELARRASLPSVLANALTRYAIAIANAERFDDAKAALDEAETVAPPTALRQLHILGARANIAGMRGDFETAASCWRETRAMYHASGHLAGEINTMFNLAEVDHRLGNTRGAIELAREALAQALGLSDGGVFVAHLSRNLAGYLVALDDLEGARSAAVRAIVSDSARDPAGAYVAIALEHLALVLALKSDATSAALLAGYSDGILRKTGFEREYTERLTHDRLKDLLAHALAEGELHDFYARGERLLPNEAIAHALELAARADAS